MRPSVSDSSMQQTSAESPSVLRVILVAAAAVLAGFGISHWLDHRQTSPWIGRLHAFETVVKAPRGGRVQEIVVASGVRVEVQQRLAVLVDDEVDRRRELARQKVATLE